MLKTLVDSVWNMVKISLDNDSYMPGGTITATVTVSLGSPTKARGLYAKLICTEGRIHRRTVVMDKYMLDREHELGVPYTTNTQQEEEMRSRVIFEQEKKVAGEGNYSSGTFTVSFTLPENAAPTSHDFGHDDRTHVWKLSAKLDLPLALDKGDEAEVIVGGL